MAKSWDIQRSPRSAPVAPALAREPERVRVPKRAVPTKRESVRAASRGAPRTPLKRRRQRARRTWLVLIGIVVVLLALGMEVVLWLPTFRVQAVQSEGPSSTEIQSFVLNDLSGTRFLILPRNSIFFLPEAQLRAHILASFPNVEAVSIAPRGLNTLAVTTSERGAAFWWCGTSLGAPLASCYQSDANGFVFAPVVLEAAQASTSMLSMYAPLTDTNQASSSPLGMTIKKSSSLPGLLQFVKAIRSLNADVVSVDIRDDEADLYTQAGTRITYVVGHEQKAANLAASSFPSLNLNDGSLLYVDLRFDSKVFFKKRGTP